MRGNSTVIDLIRYGEPEGGKRYRGQINDLLSAAGWQQMWDAIIAQVLNAPLEAIYRIDVAYAAITRIKLDGERPPQLVSHAGCRV